MTPCEELGYEVGDVFIASEGSLFSGGSTVELYRDDGSELPLWRLIEGSCRLANAGGKPGAYDALDFFTKIKETKDMIVKADGNPYATYGSAKQQLSAMGLRFTHEVVEYRGGYALARKSGEAGSAEEGQATTFGTLRLAQHRVKELSHELSIAQGVRDEALSAVRAELGEGFEISVVEGVPPGVDMGDPANWRAGDIVVAVEPGVDIHVGSQYVVEIKECGDAGFRDSAGDFRLSTNKVKWHSRPTK